MTHQITDIDAIISEIEHQAKQLVSNAGPPKITKNNVDVTLRNFTYKKPNPLTKPMSIDHLSYDNDSDLSTQAKFPARTKKTISTFTFSFTEGFKFSTKSTLKVGVPGIGDASEEINFELDFSATQTSTKTEEQSWTYDEPVPVPERSKVCADLVIDQNSYNPDFSGEVVLTGEIEAHASSGDNGDMKEDTAQIPVPGWLYDQKDKYPDIKFEDFQEFLGAKEPTKAIISVAGKFTGVSGSNMRIEVHQVKIGEDCPTSHPKADVLS